jgi:hypothetical protein
MPRMSWFRIALTFVSVLLAALALLLALVVQPGVTPELSQPPAVDAERLRAHVKHLSVDLYPRSFDQRDQLERAMEYVAREFAAAGGRVESQAVTAQSETYRNVIARMSTRTATREPARACRRATRRTRTRPAPTTTPAASPA